MLRQGFDARCSRCQRGMLMLVGRAGRVAVVDGREIAVPADFMVPTCNECGAERWDAERLAALETAVEQARLLALRNADTREMDALE